MDAVGTGNRCADMCESENENNVVGVDPFELHRFVYPTVFAIVLHR